jgi:hypothetical protein
MRDNLIRLLILILSGLVLAYVAMTLFPKETSTTTPGPDSTKPIACTEEAKLCPDGSSVGRTGPTCEFAECPAAPTTTDIQTTDETPGSDVGTLPNGAVPEFGYENELGGGGGSAGPVASCTRDAMQCPDGSYVGRTGPKCEFICPEVRGASDDRSIIGTVLVGPTCPVVNENNLEACADKPYEGRITLTNTTQGSSFDITTDAQGTFRRALPLGTYSISRDQSQNPFPTCSGYVDVTKDTRTVNIMCDSGIR